MNYSVSIYYDETEIQEYGISGHILFIVPDELLTEHKYPLFELEKEIIFPRIKLLEHIQNLRGDVFNHRKFHFKKIKNNENYDYLTTLKKLVGTLNLSMSSSKNYLFKQPAFCKLGILYYPTNHDLSNYGGKNKKERQVRYHETMFRILLKNSLHSLYRDKDKIIVNRILVDGNANHRDFSEYRITKRLLEETYYYRSPLRKNIIFPTNLRINHIDSDHKNCEAGTRQYEDANLLQCADILLGCSNYVFFPPKDVSIGLNKRILSKEIEPMIFKVKRKGGIIKSSHFNSFKISKTHFLNNEMKFINAIDMFPRTAYPGQLDLGF